MPLRGVHVPRLEAPALHEGREERGHVLLRVRVRVRVKVRVRVRLRVRVSVRVRVRKVACACSSAGATPAAAASWARVAMARCCAAKPRAADLG